MRGLYIYIYLLVIVQKTMYNVKVKKMNIFLSSSRFSNQIPPIDENGNNEICGCSIELT